MTQPKALMVEGFTSPAVGRAIARRLREARAGLTYRWLERIAERVSVEEERIFPTDELLNHVPLLVEAIAERVEDPGTGSPTSTAVVEKAAELGELRYRQGFSPYQILKEFEILGGIVLTFLEDVAREMGESVAARDFVIAAHRVQESLAAIQRATTARYLLLLDARVSDRERRLRTACLFVERDVRQRVDASLRVLDRMGIEDANGIELRGNLEILLAQAQALECITRSDGNARQQRNVTLASAAAEATRQVRDLAAERGVDVVIDADLPTVEVNAAAVEIALVSQLGAAIRFTRRSDRRRRIEISGRLEGGGARSELVVEVRDDGVDGQIDGETELARNYLLAAALDASTSDASAPDAETRDAPPPDGLALSLVRDAIEPVGGHVWVRAEADTTVLAFSLPCRRADDLPPPD